MERRKKCASIPALGSAFTYWNGRASSAWAAPTEDGFAWALKNGYDACLEMDADLSHDPADIPRLLEALEKGADAAIASRYLDGVRVINWPQDRLFLEPGRSRVCPDADGIAPDGCDQRLQGPARRGATKSRLEKFTAEGYGFQIELHYFLWKSGARLVEVPIVFTERREGNTKMTTGIAAEALRPRHPPGPHWKMITDKHTWHKADWITALVAALISFAVYAWTAAPNVTLLDSGEFIVAAQHFGVPHPTGYPVWTFLTWLFLLLPLGNAAWEVAIFSGVRAAAAVGLCAALLSNIQTWVFGDLLQGRLRRIPQLVALSFALMLAFSESMWSQAVIAEVYALHALLIGLFLVACYSWVRKPGKDSSDAARVLPPDAFVQQPPIDDGAGAVALSAHPPASAPAFSGLVLCGNADDPAGLPGFCHPVQGTRGTEDVHSPLLLRGGGFRGLCLAAPFPHPMETGRVSARGGCGRPAAAYLHAAGLGHESTDELGLRAGTGRLFLLINRSQYPDALTDVTVRSLGKLMGVNKPD